MPEKHAFQFVHDRGGEGPSLTYRALHERAMAIASKLQSLASPGERALLLYPSGLEFVEAFWGCLYAGILAVPVAPPARNRLTGSVMAVIEAARPALILTTSDKCRQAEQAGTQPAGLGDKYWIATDTIPDSHREDWREPGVGSRHTAFLQYTSGSTSTPKGVMVSHSNLLHNASLIQHSFGTSTESRAVFWLPLYHDMGLIGGIIQPVYCGGSCTLMAPAAFLQRPALWLETISRVKATVSGGPDFAYDWCERKVTPEERESLDLSSWEVAFTGAERIRAQTAEKFAKAFAGCGFHREAMFPCYGLAEATLIVPGGPRRKKSHVLHVHGSALARHKIHETTEADPAALNLFGCGECLPGQRVVIVNPETLTPCAESEVGEIWVQGPSVAGGYFEQPEATEAVFQARLADTGEGPFLRTGDLGFLRDGHLFVTGRLKDLVIIRGRNYYPEDIEHAVQGAHDGLRAGHCAAFSIDVWDQERLVIVQEVEPRRRNLDLEKALNAIRHTIAVQHEAEVYAIALVKAGEIPKTSSGKTRRSTCRKNYLSGELTTLATWKAEAEEMEDEIWDWLTIPRPEIVTASHIELWLKRRIAARLRLSAEQIHTRTPFFEFGIRSLDAVRIAADLERWLGRRLTAVVIYNYPNIAELAQWLANPSTELPIEDPSPYEQLPSEDMSPESLLEEIRQMTEADILAFISQEMIKQERN